MTMTARKTYCDEYNKTSTKLIKKSNQTYQLNNERQTETRTRLQSTQKLCGARTNF